MPNVITLSNKVIVTDPCYEVPTWCQEVLTNVLPGKYHTFLSKCDAGVFGVRNSTLLVIHENHLVEDLRWKEYSHNVGVDSGQAGVFSMESYRNDAIVDAIGLGDGDVSFFDSEPWVNMGGDKETGEKWYRAMCSRTLGENSWGTYDNGVVCSSGFGDGSYPLFVARSKRKIVAMGIDFGVSDEKYVNFDFYKNQLV